MIEAWCCECGIPCDENVPCDECGKPMCGLCWSVKTACTDCEYEDFEDLFPNNEEE